MSLAISPISERNENVAMDLLSKSESQSPIEMKKATKSNHKKSRSKSSSPTSAVSSTCSTLLDGFRIRLLLVSGKRHDFVFEKKTSILDLKNQVFLHWPQEWKHESKGSSAENLRILYHGKFLDDQLMLDSKSPLFHDDRHDRSSLLPNASCFSFFIDLRMDENSVTTLHLVPKPSLSPEKVATKSKCFSASCTCTIL